MYDVVAIGEMLIDFTTDSFNSEGYPIMSAHAGGAVANFLASLAKFGMKTAIISKVGNDAFGKLLIDTLDEHNIDSSSVSVTDDAFTTLAFVTRDQSGDRSFSFARKPGADILINENDINFDLINNAKVLHFGTVGMTAEPSRSTHKKVVKYAKENGVLISFDPNLREPLWESLDDAKEQIIWGLKNSDIIKISDNEVEFLFGLSAEDGIEHIFNAYSPKLLYVTLGKNGALFKNKICSGRIPNYDNVNTIDTTGAGDIFGGSAMYALLQTNKNPEDLDYDELVQICSFACKVASLSTENLGGISSVPDLEKIKGL